MPDFRRTSTILALAVAASSTAIAQQAPLGGHYAGRPSDTGFSGTVSAAGAYGDHIPIDLPPSRGGLPVPLAVSYGGRRLGAAGLGWDVPISYLFVDTTVTYHRPDTPLLGPGEDALPIARKRVTLSLNGTQMMLVQKAANVWVPREGQPQLELHDLATSWTMLDGSGHTYTFTDGGSDKLRGKNLFVLHQVSGVDGNVVDLNYRVEAPAITGWTASPIAIDLVRVSYNAHPFIAGCYKNEVRLNYNPDAPAPLSVAMMGDFIWVRTRTLNNVDIYGRASCSIDAVKLRRYQMNYGATDPDTGLPRLGSVEVTGRVDSDDRETILPVATYGYGSAVVGGALTYLAAESLELPFAATFAGQLQSTVHDDSVLPPGANHDDVDFNVGYATWQSLIDVTGDGRPDIVFQAGDRMDLAINTPVHDASGDSVGFSFVLPFGDATLPPGSFEARAAAELRFGAQQNSDQVWRQAIDMNGDGRIDLVDAGEEPGKWVVYLNTPFGSAPFSGVKWERRVIPIDKILEHLNEHGLATGPRGLGFGGLLPLANRVTDVDSVVQRCFVSDGSRWHEQDPKSPDCGTVIPSTFTELTFSEWELKDVNGDGFPDLVFDSTPLATSTSSNCPAEGSPAPLRGVSKCADTGTIAVGAGQEILVALNVLGVGLASDETSSTEPFAAPTVMGTSPCAVGQFIAPDPGSESRQTCGIEDVNGDGLADRVQGLTAFLGNGTTFTGATLTLPDSMLISDSPNKATCPKTSPSGITYFARNVAGLRDLNGDGLPDFIRFVGGQWSVAMGTGAGFAAAVPIAVPDVQNSESAIDTFFLSRELEACDGSASVTQAGLFDLDGDGVPEVVGPGYHVFRLAGSSGNGAVDAGRLVRIENGYGGAKVIAYRSAKDDPSLLDPSDLPSTSSIGHRIPSTEIVVASVKTVGAPGGGNDLAPVLYAYGGIDQTFDSVSDRWLATGYRRAVELRLSNGAEGTATLTDTFAVSDPSPVGGDAHDRLLRMLRAGHVRRQTELSGALGSDPWALVPTDIDADPRRIARKTFEVDVKAFTESAFESCMEMTFPYDAGKSLAAGFFNDCEAHGFLFSTSVDFERGAAGLAAGAKVETRSETQAVDDNGRVTEARAVGDVTTDDDDLCTETHYAKPQASDGPRILDAVASQRVTDCKGVLLASDLTEYDGFPQSASGVGLVSSGFPSKHTVVRIDEKGVVLGQIVTFTATPDLFKHAATVVSQRTDDAGDLVARTLSTEYDEFGVAPVSQSVSGTGVALRTLATERDPVTLLPVATQDPNGLTIGITYDGFQRMKLALLGRPADNAPVIAATSYLGFAKYEGGGRRIVHKSFTDPVPQANLGTATDRSRTSYLDELGRSTKTMVALGADYGGEAIVAGLTQYDALGRAVFMADPFPASQPAAQAYGTTAFFSTDGTPRCTVRGFGRQGAVPAATDEALELYPTCVELSYAGGQEISTSRAADAFLAGSPQLGVTHVTRATALGRTLERSARGGDGSLLEDATFTYDRLGHLATTSRMGGPGAQPETWTWHTDSLGWIDEVDMGGTSPQRRSHDDWGEVTDIASFDPVTSTDRLSIMRRDALGRLVHSETRDGNVVDPESVTDLFYDAQAPTPVTVAGEHLVGRLAQAQTPTTTIYFSYDALGRPVERSYLDEEARLYVERPGYHFDGTLESLDFILPDTGGADERVDYDYDSARRLRTASYRDTVSTQPLYQASSIDAFGRVRAATYGGTIAYQADYADVGRRLLLSASVQAMPQRSREVLFGTRDPMQRQRERDEVVDGDTAHTTHTEHTYDSLGRLASSRVDSVVGTRSQASFAYDPRGNLLGATESAAGGAAFDTIQSFDFGVDHDQACRVEYGTTVFSDNECNVLYDGAGNVIEQPTRTGLRRMSYLADGRVRTITDLPDGLTPRATAHFRYDPFGQVQSLDVESPDPAEVRHDRRFGPNLERRAVSDGDASSILARSVPGPLGILATRQGAGGPWVFAFGETRGQRFFAGLSGSFVQDVDYRSYGEATSQGAEPGTTAYSHWQWNGGDALEAFGLVELGARVYDPVMGRFLGRDPLTGAGDASAANPYAFAMNDPVNVSDPTGMCGEEGGEPCLGPIIIPGGAPPGWGDDHGGKNDRLLYQDEQPTDHLDVDSIPLAALKPKPGPTAAERARVASQEKDRRLWERRYRVGILGMLSGMDCESYGEGGDCNLARLVLGVSFQVLPALATGGTTAVGTAALREAVISGEAVAEAVVAEAVTETASVAGEALTEVAPAGVAPHINLLTHASEAGRASFFELQRTLIRAGLTHTDVVADYAFRTGQQWTWELNEEWMLQGMKRGDLFWALAEDVPANTGIAPNLTYYGRELEILTDAMDNGLYVMTDAVGEDGTSWMVFSPSPFVPIP